MYTAAILLCYYGLLRVGEVTESIHSIKAINVHEARNRNKLLLVLRTSKTHGLNSLPQQIEIIRKGELIVRTCAGNATIISKKLEGEKYCPVSCRKDYIKLRPKIRDKNEQFFIFKDRSNLKVGQFRTVIKNIIGRMKLDPNNYDVHSFRIG